MVRSETVGKAVAPVWRARAIPGATTSAVATTVTRISHVPIAYSSLVALVAKRTEPPRRPFLYSLRGPVAQSVEQGTFNPKVAGSIPARPTAAERVWALVLREAVSPAPCIEWQRRGNRRGNTPLFLVDVPRVQRSNQALAHTPSGFRLGVSLREFPPQPVRFSRIRERDTDRLLLGTVAVVTRERWPTPTAMMAAVEHDRWVQERAGQGLAIRGDPQRRSARSSRRRRLGYLPPDQHDVNRRFVRELPAMVARVGIAIPCVVGRATRRAPPEA